MEENGMKEAMISWGLIEHAAGKRNPASSLTTGIEEIDRTWSGIPLE